MKLSPSSLQAFHTGAGAGRGWRDVGGALRVEVHQGTGCWQRVGSREQRVKKAGVALRSQAVGTHLVSGQGFGVPRLCPSEPLSCQSLSLIKLSMNTGNKMALWDGHGCPSGIQAVA